MAEQLTRRRFIGSTAATLGAVAMARQAYAAAAQRPPSFIILVGEDMSPDIGCYGSTLAHTPNLDALAAQGARFNHCFTHCPVCAPSRSGMITGQYPTAIGTHHMRSTLLRPPPMFTSYMQKVGYRIIWTNKTDFNFGVPRGAFDSTADWRTGDLPADQPFLAFFNIFHTHESQVRGNEPTHAKNTRRLKPAERQDADKIPLPPFYPDTPEVRHDVRQYHELCTAVDYDVGDVMAMLEKKKLADNTVLIFTGDHGRGMPRMKRWCYDDGTHIPLIVRWPNGIKPGTVSDQLVSMIDLPSTILTLAGITPPAAFAGTPYLGSGAPPRRYVYAHRDRMDEACDRVRSVRDGQYRYIRNFQPDLPYSQYINYNELNPIMRVWRAAAKQGKLTRAQMRFFAHHKPAEELYDCRADPHAMNNLATSDNPAIGEKLTEMRLALDQWLVDTRDLGATTEPDLIKQGLVADKLTVEYNERIKLHPKEPCWVEM